MGSLRYSINVTLDGSCDHRVIPPEVTTQLGWSALDGDVGRWIGNRNQASQWGWGLIAGHAFSERLELYDEPCDLQDANRIYGLPKQHSLTLNLGGRQSLDRADQFQLLFMGGRAIQNVTGTNGEPSWIAYMCIQRLLGPKDKEEASESLEGWRMV